MARSIAVILNSGSGSHGEGTREEIERIFTEKGVDADFYVAENGEDIAGLVQKAVNAGAKTIVAGGGDGTISSIAGETVRLGVTLGVLPLGTLNNFSKDLGLPTELAEVVGVIGEANTQAVDIGVVNDKTFINNSSIGLYPQIVRSRERQQRLGRGKWFAAFSAAISVFKRSPFIKVKLTMDGCEIKRKTPFVFVGNNDYEMDLYNIGRRPKLDDGKLSVYLVKHGGRKGVLIMLLKTITGQVKQWSDFEEFQTTSVVIRTRKRSIAVAYDGEATIMETPLCYSIKPKALTVIVPKQTEDNGGE